MAVYTCFDMVRDCRTGRPEGWQHFISEYLPFCRAVIEQYAPERTSDPDALQTLLTTITRPGCPVFDVSGTTPEREFLLGLRMLVLRQMQTTQPEHPEPPSAGLTDVSPLERQIAWLEVMKYDDHHTARMLNIDQNTVASARAKVRSALEGARLEGIALTPASANCASPRLLADYMDGRITWSRREELDRHLNECWRCVDLFCRVREADYLMHRRRRLSQDEVDRLLQGLGIEKPRSTFWQKLRSVGWN